jgi:hypothetical protein
MEAMMKIYRQGDVLLLERPKVAYAAGKGTDRPSDARGLVLAEGETSGHCHVVFPERAARLFDFAEDGVARTFLALVGGGASVRVVGGEVGGVPRHTPVQIPVGTYEVRIQRSWDSSHAAHRQVND